MPCVGPGGAQRSNFQICSDRIPLTCEALRDLSASLSEMSPNLRTDNYIIHSTNMPTTEQSPPSLKGQKENTPLPTVPLRLIHPGKSVLLPESPGVENYTEVYNVHRENHFKHNIVFLPVHF